MSCDIIKTAADCTSSINDVIYYINITFPGRVIVENIIPRNVINNRGED